MCLNGRVADKHIGNNDERCGPSPVVISDLLISVLGGGAGLSPGSVGGMVRTAVVVWRRGVWVILEVREGWRGPCGNRVGKKRSGGIFTGAGPFRSDQLRIIGRRTPARGTVCGTGHLGV